MTAELMKVEPGCYTVRKNGAIIGHIQRQYQRATGNSRYVGYVPGHSVWEIWNVEDGRMGVVVDTCRKLTEAKETADRLFA